MWDSKDNCYLSFCTVYISGFSCNLLWPLLSTKIPSDVQRLCCAVLLAVNHLHLPARRKPFRACCPWPTCPPLRPWSSHGATASQRATHIAHRCTRKAAQELVGAAASGRAKDSRRNLEKAAASKAWIMMTMSRITWMHVSRIQIMVSRRIWSDSCYLFKKKQAAVHCGRWTSFSLSVKPKCLFFDSQSQRHHPGASLGFPRIADP